MVLDELDLSYNESGFTKNRDEGSPSPGSSMKGKIDLSKLDLKVKEAKMKKSYSKEEKVTTDTVLVVGKKFK